MRGRAPAGPAAWAGRLLAAGLALAAAGPAAAALSEDEARQAVRQSFEVEILDSRAGRLADGREVWLVKVMRKGGNSNAAFKVDTVAVDKATGALLLGAHREASDDDDLTAARTGATEKRPAASRSFMWR